ncbi:hypothetical protein CFBP6600_03500 [Xanthomonas arboricola pv. corylina]|nr:hypothetical protein CFBP6600_03500 [Xanthomonas arboricola pv. corylina]CAE6698108.1 hypothetical protein CFBP6600_03500 [Xanthomonas arboricola pv. corylina]
MCASTGSMASGVAEGVLIRSRPKRTSAIAGGRQPNPTSFRLGRCRSALVREGVTGRATSRTGALLQKPWCCRLEISLLTALPPAPQKPYQRRDVQGARRNCQGQRHLAFCWQVGAHLCARALPGEPHRARVRSYNNRGVLGSGSAWLTALPPAPTDAGPAARCPGRRARLPGPAGPAASGLRYPDSARRAAAAARWRRARPTRPVRRRPD